MDSEHIYNQLANAFTYAGKDKIIAYHITNLYRQLEEPKKQDHPKGTLEPIELDIKVEYYHHSSEGWVLKRESKDLSYRWYVYRDELMGERCPNWWWEEITDYKRFEDLYQSAR